MSIQSLDAMSAYAKALHRPGVAGADPQLGGLATDGAVPAGSAFSALVDKAVTNALSATQASERAAADAVTGKADLVDVVTAVNAAELSLQTLVAVRDKVISAYQDILRMPI
jgi:flagellar hook-basal body complex protein FliE